MRPGGDELLGVWVFGPGHEMFDRVKRRNGYGGDRFELVVFVSLMIKPSALSKDTDSTSR